MEYFDVIDEFGVPTGQIVERGKAHAEGIRHRTSHVWLLRKHMGKVQILLQKRCENKDSFPGCYDISSAGHIPAGSEYIESAIRELREELGIEVSCTELITCGDRDLVEDGLFHGKEFHDRQHSRVFILWKDLNESDFKLQEEEVERVLWMDFDECIKVVRDNTIKHCIFLGELEMVKETVDQCM